jgi:hypothetical protein
MSSIEFKKNELNELFSIKFPLDELYDPDEESKHRKLLIQKMNDYFKQNGTYTIIRNLTEELVIDNIVQISCSETFGLIRDGGKVYSRIFKPSYFLNIK